MTELDLSWATSNKVAGRFALRASVCSCAWTSRNGPRIAASTSVPYVSAQLRTLISLTLGKSAAVASRTEKSENGRVSTGNVIHIT